MSNPKPALVLLYRDPFAKCEARLCYWPPVQVTPVGVSRGSRLLVEHIGADALGEPAWQAAGEALRTDIVLAALLHHVVRDITTYGANNGPTTIVDLRHVEIPCHEV